MALHFTDENFNILSSQVLGLKPNTDITSQLLSIISDVKYQNKTIQFERKAKYIISQPIEIDLYYYGIDGNGCIFEFTINDSTKYGITLTSSLSTKATTDGIVNGGSPAGNITLSKFDNIIMQTPNRDKRCNGLLISNTKGKSAHITTNKVALLGFNNGISFGSETYMCTFFQTNVQYCNTGIFLNSGFSDMGERLTFDGGCIGDNVKMIVNKTDQALHFNNVSFDFSDKWFENSGQLYFVNCHVEAPTRYFKTIDYDNDPWAEQSSNGSVFIANSRLLLNYDGTNLPYLIKNNSNDNGVYITNCHTHIFAKYITNNNGVCRVRGTHRYNKNSPYTYSSEKNNIYDDKTCIDLSRITSTNTSYLPTLDNNRYKCTHQSKGVNTIHTINLGKLPSNSLVTFTLETSVANNFFFNDVSFNEKVGSSYINKKAYGSISTVSGVNTVTLRTSLVYNDADVPTGEIALRLNSFDIASDTTFYISNIKVIPLYY